MKVWFRDFTAVYGISIIKDIDFFGQIGGVHGNMTIHYWGSDGTEL